MTKDRPEIAGPRAIAAWATFRRLLRMGAGYRWAAAAAFVLIVIASVLEGAAIPVLFAQIIYAISPSGGPGVPAAAARFKWVDTSTPTAQLDGLLLYSALIVLAYFLRSAATFGHLYLGQVFAQRVVLTLRNRLHSHLMRLSAAFHDSRQTGELMSRVTNDVNVLQSLVSGDLMQAMQAPVMIVVGLATMLVISWKLTLLSLLCGPPIALLLWRLGGQVRQITRVVQARLADLNARLQERLSSVRVVQLFAMEEYEREQFSRVNRETMKANLAAARITSALYPGVEFVALLGMIVVLAIAGWQVISAQLGTAVFFMFLVVLQRAGSQLSRLGRIRVAIQQALGAGERVFELLETESEVVEAPDAEVLPPVRGEVTFEHVTLRYRGGEEALRDVNLTIRPGEVVALVGPSGAGKTSLANLILRFYDPTEGTIRIDGRDLRRVTLSSLRGQVGTVPQETLLFGGTVHDNIVYGRIQATRDEVMAAAAAANADEFIAALPAAYDTPVGERGVKLSGGQRQRIAIARALLRNPRILILDEATSSLDAESESLVQEALERLMEGRTTLVIAHRLSTIRHADRILVLSDGRVVEEGTHIQLIQRQGVYSRLYERQIREQDAPASAG